MATGKENKHFNLASDRLETLDSYYDALPAHAGIWRAEQDTAEDLLARLAVVPMVLEARGLYVRPYMIETFKRPKNTGAVEALETIYAEEKGHVACGAKWFNFLCSRNNRD